MWCCNVFLGYNTNGFAHHRLEDAIVILAELGYQGVAITLDYHALNPFDPDLTQQIGRVRSLLQQYQLRSVIETGSRFLLNPKKKHSPTLVDPVSMQSPRLDFLKRAIDIGVELGSDAISFWSGASSDGADFNAGFERMRSPLRELCAYATQKQIRLAFEPEPGMTIDTMTRYQQLFSVFETEPVFGLTLDVGHLHCLGEFPIRSHILQWKKQLWNIHIEDMKQGIHDHLMFGEGEMDFAEIFNALHEIDYQHGLYVELSRHSHNAVQTARDAMSFLKRYA